MPRHENVPCSTTAPAQLTSAAVAAVRVSNHSGYDAWLQATATSTAPSNRSGAIKLPPGAVLAADLELAMLFPGVGSDAMYLWAFVDALMDLSVSHA